MVNNDLNNTANFSRSSGADNDVHHIRYLIQIILSSFGGNAGHF